MVKLTKKQRVALREIDAIASERKRDRLLGILGIVLIIPVIVIYNTVTYQMGIVSAGDSIIRSLMYITAMVLAGFSGIMLMRASQKQRKIDGFRQQAGISRETLEAWNKGEIE